MPQITHVPLLRPAPLREEFRSIDTSDQAVRRFGYLLVVIAVIAAAWLTYRAGWTPPRSALITLSAGGALAVLGRFLPGLLRPVFRLWMMLAVVLGFVMTRVILSIVFYVVVTPIGLVMRLAGRDPLSKKPDPSMDSYWISVRREAETPDQAAARLRRYY